MGLSMGVSISVILDSFNEKPTFKQWFKEMWNELIMIFFVIAFSIIMFPLNRSTYETQGITKYLNKEIVIDKTEITYDSQNQPIDTVYHYVRARNHN